MDTIRSVRVTLPEECDIAAAEVCGPFSHHTNFSNTLRGVLEGGCQPSLWGQTPPFIDCPMLQLKHSTWKPGG